MHILEKNLRKAEAIYEKDKNGHNALILFACNILVGKTIEKEGARLNKAYHVAVTAHRNDLLDMNMIVAVLHANVLLGNFESAYELISALEPHSSFLSKNMPMYYGQILYLQSVVQANTERIRSAKKIHRNLEILYEKTGLTPLLEYLGSLQRLVFDDVNMCAKMYLEAMNKRHKGVYFYLDIYDILIEETVYSQEMNELSKRVIPWALNKDLQIDVILDRIEKKTLIQILFSLSIGHLSKIFKRYEHVGAFQCLCQRLIYANDTSKKALGYYRIALKNNLTFRGLPHVSIKAAYINKFYGLPAPVVENAILNSESMEPELLAFLYGVLLRQDAGSEAIGEHREKIVKFAMTALANGYRGKDFNSLYRFMYEMFPKDERFRDIIMQELFKNEIEFKSIAPQRVWVYEYAKSGVSEYIVDNNKCYISSVGHFKCYFMGGFGDTKEYITIDDYNVTKMLGVDRAKTIEQLYKSGYATDDILIALALDYLKDKSLNKEMVEIMQSVSALPQISDNLRMDIYGAIAAYYEKIEHHGIAAHFYSQIGEKAIKRGSLTRAVNSYILTGRHDKALSLITKKHYLMPDADVFNALSILHEKVDSLEIASVCYKLILNDLCSAEILSIVVKKFKGTADEWLIIANKIDSLGFDVTGLYEKIIVNGIFTGSIGNDCNRAFIKLYLKNKTHPIIPKYVYFCCYEIIKNGKSISDELADILQEIFEKDDSDPLLCYAVACGYIANGRQDKATVISEAAMYLEQEDIILPCFKEYQDKSFITSYIEKNTPFVYISPPHKNIFICYKTLDQSSYTKKPMKYYRFGMYFVNLALFYGEKITYYFENENGAKSDKMTFTNTHMRIIEQFKDMYYTVNNAIIYENMMKYDMVEAMMEQELSDKDEFHVITL